jgi:hypothetical protein
MSDKKAGPRACFARIAAGLHCWLDFPAANTANPYRSLAGPAGFSGRVLQIVGESQSIQSSDHDSYVPELVRRLWIAAAAAGCRRALRPAPDRRCQSGPSMRPAACRRHRRPPATPMAVAISLLVFIRRGKHSRRIHGGNPGQTHASSQRAPRRVAAPVLRTCAPPARERRPGCCGCLRCRSGSGSGCRRPRSSSAHPPHRWCCWPRSHGGSGGGAARRTSGRVRPRSARTHPSPTPPPSHRRRSLPTPAASHRSGNNSAGPHAAGRHPGASPPRLPSPASCRRIITRSSPALCHSTHLPSLTRCHPRCRSARPSSFAEGRVRRRRARRGAPSCLALQQIIGRPVSRCACSCLGTATQSLLT